MSMEKEERIEKVSLRNKNLIISESKLIVIPDGKICDYIDGKFRNDTQEEYVRQNIEKRLINELKYDKDRLKVEFTLSAGSSKPRADLVMFPKNCSVYSQENIQIIIECKKETVEPRAQKDGIAQLKSYMSVCPNCGWGLWTNGKHKEVFRKVINSEGKIDFIEFNDIPSQDGTIEEIERPKRNTLRNAVNDNLLFAFKTCHSHIYATDGLEKAVAFFELLKVIFCKILDERNIPNPLEFYTTSSERSNPDGQLTVKNRIDKIFGQVKNKYNKIFAPNETINLKPRSLAWIVSELQGYSLLNTHIDIKGKAYEEIVGANLRGDKGQFFTPRNIMRMTVEMINPKLDEKVLDPACGTGGFLVTAMNHAINKLETIMTKQIGKPKNAWSNEEIKMVQGRISEIASTNYFGFDIAPELVKATKMNMVMNNDGSGNILNANSLLPPHEWEPDFKSNLTKAIGNPDQRLTNHKNIAFFDIIITNPPFGAKIPVKDAAILSQYELGYIWEKPSKGTTQWKKTDRLQGSVPPEQLFIERCLQFLKPGGRMGIVLPDAILGSPGLGYIRQWLIGETYIIASIDLHVDTFQPRNGTQTSILILQKKTPAEKNEELKMGYMKPYNIFMAMVEHVGHDKRGNTIYIRDDYGNEILVSEEQNILELDRTAGGSATVKTQSKTKVIDDQSVYVPEVFNSWKHNEGIVW